MFSQCVHGVYEEKTEAVQREYSLKNMNKKDSKSTYIFRYHVFLFHKP